MYHESISKQFLRAAKKRKKGNDTIRGGARGLGDCAKGENRQTVLSVTSLGGPTAEFPYCSQARVLENK